MIWSTLWVAWAGETMPWRASGCLHGVERTSQAVFYVGGVHRTGGTAHANGDLVLDLADPGAGSGLLVHGWLALPSRSPTALTLRSEGGLLSCAQDQRVQVLPANTWISAEVVGTRGRNTTVVGCGGEATVEVGPDGVGRFRYPVVADEPCGLWVETKTAMWSQIVHPPPFTPARGQDTPVRIAVPQVVGMLGVNYESVPGGLAVVYSLRPDGALAVGDVLEAVGGRALHPASEWLLPYLADRMGQVLTVRVLRNGRRMDVPVEVLPVELL